MATRRPSLHVVLLSTQTVAVHSSDSTATPLRSPRTRASLDPDAFGLQARDHMLRLLDCLVSQIETHPAEILCRPCMPPRSRERGLYETAYEIALHAIPVAVR